MILYALLKLQEKSKREIAEDKNKKNGQWIFPLPAYVTLIEM